MKRINSKYGFLILLLLCLCHFSEGQTIVLSLDSCKRMAMLNQAKVKNAELEVLAAKETKAAALTKYFPSVSLSAGWFRSRDYLIDVNSNDISDNDNAQLSVDATFDGQDIGDNLQELIDDLGYDIDLRQELENLMDHLSLDAHLQMFNQGMFANALVTQPVFAGGRIVNGNKLAQLGVDVAELQLLMTRDEVELNVEESYWLVVSLKEKMKMVVQAELMLDTLERDVEAGVGAGIVGRSDLLKVKLKKSELASIRTQLDHGVRLATMSLLQQIGLSYADTAVYRIEGDVEAMLHKVVPQNLTLEDCSSLVNNRKESQLLDHSVRAEELKKSMILGETLPQVAVGATYGVNNLMGDIKDNAILFATINVPISGWWEASHNIRKQDYLRQEAQNNADDLRGKMLLQTRQVYDALDEALQLLAIRKQAVRDAEESLEESRNYYEAGMTGVVDYLESLMLLRQAESEYVDQLVTTRMAMVRCEQMTDGNK